ncbi:MAG: alpha/beta fold hydrolase [Candidatus Dormibacteria bacterium]
MAEEKGRPDLDSLIERFEEDVRLRPLPAAEETSSTAPMTAPAQGSPMPAAVVEEIRAELAEPTAAPVPALQPLPGDIEGWWQQGRRIELQLPGNVRRTVFARVYGSGPWLTMIHGFPTSSLDWLPILPLLAARHTVVVLDLLGFGDSDKPSGHDWSAFEQADIVEALWKELGIHQTRVVAHDVGLTVSLELLARQQEGRLGVRLQDLTLLNGGVYTGFHRPRPIQVWLQRPLIGPLIARLLSERRFGPALAEIFGPDHQPTKAELHQHWLSVARRNGSRNYHRLIRYIPERRANATRWEAALEKTGVPTRFVWGMADPVSGAHMVEVIRERRPGADVVELAGVGHYPQLEAPERVASAILEGPRDIA